METNEPNFRGKFWAECRGRYSEPIKSVADFFIPNFVGSKEYFTGDQTLPPLYCIPKDCI